MAGDRGDRAEGLSWLEIAPVSQRQTGWPLCGPFPDLKPFVRADMLFIVRRGLCMLLNPYCPCGHPVPYSHCCHPYLTGQALAPTAEALMRSRYTAYSQGQVDYLIATWHPQAGKARDRATLLQSSQQTRWLGLTIVKTQKGQARDQRGIVEFVALYQTLPPLPLDRRDLGPVDAIHQLHERSRFVQTKGHWLYVDGDALPPIHLNALAP